MRRSARQPLTPEPDRPALGEHVEQLLLDRRADVVRRSSARAPCPATARRARSSVRHRRQEADAELRGQVAEHPEQPEVRERRRDREVDAGRSAAAARGRGRRSAPPPRRRRRRSGRSARGRASPPRRSRRGRSGAGGSGPCRASRCPCGPRGRRARAAARRRSRRWTLAGWAGTPPIFGSEHAEARIALEEVLDGEVQRPRARVLLLDRLGDHRGVGRQRAGVVGDEQRAAVGRDVLDALDLAAEPQVVEEVVDASGRRSPRRARSGPSR